MTSYLTEEERIEAETYLRCLACGSRGTAYAVANVGNQIKCNATGLYGGWCTNCAQAFHFPNPVGSQPAWACPRCNSTMSIDYISFDVRKIDEWKNRAYMLEAHHIPDWARQQFDFGVTEPDLEGLVKRADRLVDDWGGGAVYSSGLHACVLCANEDQPHCKFFRSTIERDSRVSINRRCRGFEVIPSMIKSWQQSIEEAEQC